MTRRRPAAGLAVAMPCCLALVLGGCAPNDGVQPTAGDSSTVDALRVEVLAEYPHDTTLYTQGLEIADGVLYEGTGLNGSSVLRRSSVSADGTPGATLGEVALDAAYFGEGITVVGDRVWQLTWQEGVAFERDAQTLAEVGTASYDGEGWGLCHDDRAGAERLVMSDGTDRLTFRDPDTFAATGSVDVTGPDGPLTQINELECVDDVVWANVYLSDDIVRIDPASGAVTGIVDASGLLDADEQAGADVLNGIAAIPGTDEFLITGKWWPTTFRVRFVAA